MTQAQRYRLKLSRLDFVSLVDDPAQPNATTLLIKRNGALVEGETHAKFVKANDELGVAFFWAFTSTNPDGSDHFDLHGDAIDKSNLVKIAMDFMVNGNGAVDEMHDGVATEARCVAFPMDPDIAKAFGVATKTSGLMVMIKLTDEQLTKLKNGTYTGVSIAGLGTREPIEARKSRVVKSCMYTDEVDGHQHKLEVYEDGSIWCCYATSSGADASHNHGVVLENGQLTILTDSGHKHELAEGQAGVVVVPADATVLVAARAPHSKPSTSITSKSTPSDNSSKVDTMKPIVLSEAQFAHYSKLSGADAEAFVAKSFADRDSDVAKAIASDPEVYKTESGISIRKSHGEVALMLAKQADENARALAKANEVVLAEKSAREMVELKKRAKDTIGNLACSDDAHCAVLKAVESISDEKLRGEALAVLKAANDLMASKGRAPGMGGTDPKDGASAQELLDSMTTEYAQKNNVDRPSARVAIMKTAEGKRLYAESIR